MNGWLNLSRTRLVVWKYKQGDKNARQKETQRAVDWQPDESGLGSEPWEMGGGCVFLSRRGRSSDESIGETLLLTAMEEG